MQNVLILSGVFQKRIWGGHYFRDHLNLTKDDEIYGEYWTLSAHPNGESKVLNGKLADLTLNYVYKQYPSLFGNINYNKFPLLVKLIDASDDLSVQVHPGDEYALKNENEFGKNEFWYIIDCQPNSEIILGHKAKTIEELKTKINENRFDDLLNKRMVNKGDSFFIEDGIIHAIGKNIVILEVQQSSDVTYRVYDYNRADINGNKRPLHIEKALDVIKLEDEIIIETYQPTLKDGVIITKLTDNAYFKVYKYEINNIINFKNNDNKFYLCTVIDGLVEVEGNRVERGQSFIITTQAKNTYIEGKSTIIVSTI